MPAEAIEFGPFGIGWLKPQGLFGLDGFDPLVHAVFWSLFANIAVHRHLAGDRATPLARYQSRLFIDVFGARPKRGERDPPHRADTRPEAHRRPHPGPAEAVSLFSDARASVQRLPATN